MSVGGVGDNTQCLAHLKRPHCAAFGPSPVEVYKTCDTCTSSERLQPFHPTNFAQFSSYSSFDGYLRYYSLHHGTSNSSPNAMIRQISSHAHLSRQRDPTLRIVLSSKVSSWLSSTHLSLLSYPLSSYPIPAWHRIMVDYAFCNPSSLAELSVRPLFRLVFF
ncbi:hypothetical protein BDZ89DRAFT_446782 [Hymenopellis radicata]|nr:hypothetical protein BDZ89DRAFT_446782 [Hymenopellis radicata]